jgi:GNAT superfamily N-acetyltransferase
MRPNGVSPVRSSWRRQILWSLTASENRGPDIADEHEAVATDKPEALTMLAEAELQRLHAQVAEDLLTASPAVVPLDLENAEDCTRWRACELCSFLDNRVDDLADLPGPGEMTEADIAAWSARLLLPGEHITDPRTFRWYTSYWLVADGVRIGTVALHVWDPGWGGPYLELASLYLLREHRRRGHARRLLAALLRAVERVELSSLRLETSWLWQPALRLYLDCGFSVVNWKHALRLVRWRDEPPVRVRISGDRMELLSGSGETCLISAVRAGERLLWQDRRPADAQRGPAPDPEPTLALWLAVAGWPLIRSEQTWAERTRWMDAGMPEGLARRIRIWEAYTRHHGLAVCTPRIPGLAYPTWEQFESESSGVEP